MWSLGCLIYEIIALRPPFEANSHLNLAMKIKSGKIDRIPIRYSEDLWMVIKELMERESNKRIGCEEVIKKK